MTQKTDATMGRDPGCWITKDELAELNACCRDLSVYAKVMWEDFEELGVKPLNVFDEDAERLMDCIKRSHDLLWHLDDRSGGGLFVRDPAFHEGILRLYQLEDAEPEGA